MSRAKTARRWCQAQEEEQVGGEVRRGVHRWDEVQELEELPDSQEPDEAEVKRGACMGVCPGPHRWSTGAPSINRLRTLFACPLALATNRRGAAGERCLPGHRDCKHKSVVAAPFRLV